MSKRDVPLLLDDIIESIEKISLYTAEMTLESFEVDGKTLDAVVRNLEIIGEAANNIPIEFRKQITEIEWKQIIGMRHRIIHEYFGVDEDIVWSVIHDDLPVLKHQIIKLLKTITPETPRETGQAQ